MGIVYEFLDLIAYFVSNITWPIVALIIVIIFRKSIQSLISTVRELKYKDMSASFDAKTSKLRKLRPNDDVDEDSDILLLKDSTFSPKAKIIKAWQKIESIAVTKYIELVDNSATDIDPFLALNYFELCDVLNTFYITNAARFRSSSGVH